MALTSNLLKFAAGVSGAIDRGVNETADQVVTTAQQRVPVDTGALRTSIEKFGAAGTGERTVEAGQSLDYAPHVEYGTDRQAAQPFMTPAAEQHRADLARNIAAQLKDLDGRCRI